MGSRLSPVSFRPRSLIRLSPPALGGGRRHPQAQACKALLGEKGGSVRHLVPGTGLVKNDPDGVRSGSEAPCPCPRGRGPSPQAAGTRSPPPQPPSTAVSAPGRAPEEPAPASSARNGPRSTHSGQGGRRKRCSGQEGAVEFPDVTTSWRSGRNVTSVMLARFLARKRRRSSSPAGQRDPAEFNCLSRLDSRPRRSRQILRRGRLSTHPEV